MSRARNRVFLSNRFQLVLALLLAVGVPFVARGVFVGLTDSAAVNASFFVALVAVLMGHYFLRSLSLFPGSRSAYYVTPSFMASYGLAMFGLFVGRIDYSRTVVLSSLVICILLYVGLCVLIDRSRSPRIGVVPYGNLARLYEMGHVQWRTLRSTDESRRGLDGLVADFRADLPDEWERMLADCALEGTVVYHVKQLHESLSGRVQVEHLSENSFGSLVPLVAYLRVKMFIDVVVAALLLPFLAPVFIVLAIVVRLDSSGPAFFRQERIGYRGRPFTVFKMRTMRVEGDAAIDQRMQAITLDDDVRVTRTGRFLRRSRLDELPQVFNVLRGEMSWIGPRPEAASLSEWYERELPFYRYRHVVRPGISGWAQVNQGHVSSVTEVREKLENDFYYIKFFSPWLDLLIVIKTIRTMLTGFGSR